MPPGSTRPPSLSDVLVPLRTDRLTAINQAEGRLNRVGTQIVNNYLASNNKFPGGDCTDVSWERVTRAAGDVGVLPLFFFEKSSDVGRLWYSRIEPKSSWLRLPWLYRGQGAAGALAYAGFGGLVDGTGIWAGKLQPGAVIQAWKTKGDYYRVREGEEPQSYGHSFIFLNYVHSNTAITGMCIADQGFLGDRPFVTRNEFALWFGANHNSGVQAADLLY